MCCVLGAHLNCALAQINAVARKSIAELKPEFSDGVVWVTHVDGSDVTSIDAAMGTLLAMTPTGPSPRILTAGGGAIWTLNQGDGSLTRIDAQTRKATQTIAVGTPGHGGDIVFGDGTVWTTVVHVPLSAIDGATGELRCHGSDLEEIPWASAMARYG